MTNAGHTATIKSRDAQYWDYLEVERLNKIHFTWLLLVTKKPKPKQKITGLMHIEDVLHLQETDFSRLNFFRKKGGNVIPHQRLNPRNIFLAMTAFGRLVKMRV